MLTTDVISTLETRDLAAMTAAALRGFTLDVRAGEVIALVGPSGAGKSTVLSMVIGFVRPSRGRLLLDGRDMNELDLRSVRRGLSVD